MAEYIERKKVAGLLCKLICGSDRGLCVSTPENCLQKRMLELYDLPAADVAPVRHGRWEQGDMYDYGDVCSLCDWDSAREPCDLPYCPNCGAKMDGDGNET